jgi:hypothetical protein
MAADRGELCPRRIFGIVDRGRGAEPFEALNENVRGRGRIQDPAVEKYVVPAVGNFAAGGEFHHRHAGEYDPTQRAFAARPQHAVTIAHGDQAGRTMFPLKLGGTEKNGELAGSVTNTVAGGPLGAM